jgi:hypothetical protein
MVNQRRLGSIKAARQLASTGVLDIAEAPVPLFGARDVADILKVESWKLQKLLESPTLNLPKPRKLGTTTRATRVFTDIDVLRIALAVELTADGVSAKAIGTAVLPAFEDKEEILGLTVRNGTMQAAQYGLALMRSGDVLSAETFPWDGRERFTTKNNPHYVRNVTELLKPYAARIQQRGK